MKRTPLSRFTPLARSTGLAGTGSLPKSSAKSRAVKAEKSKLGIAKVGPCFSCKRWSALDRSHILPEGMNKLQAANPLNIVGECRSCHTLWGEKLSVYAATYPEALAEKVRLMRLVDTSRWTFWMAKNEWMLSRNAGLTT